MNMNRFTMSKAQELIFDAYEIAFNLHGYSATAERQKNALSATHIRVQAKALLDLLVRLDASTGTVEAKGKPFFSELEKPES